MRLNHLFDTDDQLSESLADEFMALARAKGMNPRLRGTPDQERARTDAVMQQRAGEPKPASADVDHSALQAKLKELESQLDPNYQYSDDYSFWTKQNRIAQQISSIKKQLGQGLNEFAPSPKPDGGNYLKALASAWYNMDLEMLKHITKQGKNAMDHHIDVQQSIEKILERGIHCGDGKVRKYSIDYNSNFDGVEIQSHDHYEYADTDDAGNDIDERTGRPWGPYDVVAFHDNELKEGVAEAYQFKGSFPFDVDHMNGPRGINLPSAPTKKFFTDKKQWSQAVDDINSSKYDDNSEYTGVTGRTTVSIDGHEWAKWSDAQQKGYIELSSMDEQGVAEAPGAETLAHNQSTVASNEKAFDLEEGDKIGGMDADQFDSAMARLKQLAGAGPLKTVYDPNTRRYKNVPVAQQPAQQPKK